MLLEPRATGSVSGMSASEAAPVPYQAPAKGMRLGSDWLYVACYLPRQRLDSMQLPLRLQVGLAEDFLHRLCHTLQHPAPFLCE